MIDVEFVHVQLFLMLIVHVLLQNKKSIEMINILTNIIYFFEIFHRVYRSYHVDILSLYSVNQVIDKQVVLEEINQDRNMWLYDKMDYFVTIYHYHWRKHYIE
jgi:hypothetical protein